MSVTRDRLAISAMVLATIVVALLASTTEYRAVVPWQIGVVLLAFAVALGAGPAIVRWTQVRRGEPPLTWTRVGAVCLASTLAAAVTVPVASFLVLMLLVGVSLPEWTALLVATPLSLVCAVLIVLGALRSAVGRGVILWCLGVLMACSGFALDGCGLRTVGRIRDVSKRAVDASNLRGLGHALEIYHKDHGAYPAGLTQLVDANVATPKQLISIAYAMHNPVSIPDEVDKPYTGPCQYHYFQLPFEASADLVWIWQDASHNDDEGGWALFRSGQVEWLEAGELERRVAETRAWLKRHSRTVSTQPVRQQQQ